MSFCHRNRQWKFEWVFSLMSEFDTNKLKCLKYCRLLRISSLANSKFLGGTKSVMCDVIEICLITFSISCSIFFQNSHPFPAYKTIACSNDKNFRIYFVFTIHLLQAKLIYTFNIFVCLSLSVRDSCNY